MFNIGNILKRSWETVWKYKVLWVFGFLIALTGGGGSNGGTSGGSRFTSNFTGKDLTPGYKPGSTLNQFDRWAGEAGRWLEQNIQPFFATEERTIQTIIWVVVGLVGISIIVGLLYALVRYPAETAIMRMVDEHEQTGTRKKFKEGWRLGWNKRALRVWLIDLIIGTPAFVVIAGILTAGVFFTINVVGTDMFEKQLPGWIGLIVLIFFFFLFISLMTAFLGLLRHFFVRAAALEGVTLGEAFKQGWQMFKVNLSKSLLMWLVMLGIGIGFGFVMIFAAILLVPAYVVMALPGAVVGVIPGLIGFGITSAFSSGVLPWIVGGISALPFFFMVMFAPLTFVLGMFVLFQSSVWTLTYRQFKAMATPPPALEEEIEPALPA